MKNRNKILGLLLLVVVTLLLVSCGAKEDTTLKNFVVDNVNEDTFVEEFNEDTTLNLNFYIVLANGSVTNYQYEEGEVVVAEDSKTETRGLSVEVKKAEIDESGLIKTYTLQYSTDSGSSLETEFKQYKIQPNNETSIAIGVNYLEYELNEGPFTHHQGYSYNSDSLAVYLLKADGSKTVVEDHSKLRYNGSTENPYSVMTADEKSFINNTTRTFELSVDGVDVDAIELMVVIAGGKAPIHPKTSSFWNWIFLQTPMAYVASFFGKLTGNSLGWAIVLTTILVRTLAWPIYAKTNDMSMKMAIAQPDMQKVQNKYATRKDPESQQKMQMELMAVYKKHNINMFGCLLPLLQMPIFLAMFQVVSRIAIPGGLFYESVTKTKFIGIELGDVGGITWVNFLLSAIVGSTMFLLQKISAKKPSYAKTTPQPANSQGAQSEQTMKMVSYFMIFMMVFASFSVRSLAFYWVIGNIFSIGQTLFNKHLSEVKYQKLEDEKLYGKNYKPSGNVIDAKFTNKDDKK